MKLIFIRHGETDVNAQNNGHSPDDQTPLNKNGVSQAKKLIGVCKNNTTEIIFTSLEKRAHETASIIGNALMIKVETMPDLHERNWGQWQGSWIEIKSKLEKMNLDERYTFIPPGGESWKQMEMRIKNCLDYILKQPYTSVAVIAHGGVLRALMPILKNAPLEVSFEIEFANASVSIFEYKDNVFKQIAVNDTSHL